MDGCICASFLALEEHLCGPSNYLAVLLSGIACLLHREVSRLSQLHAGTLARQLPQRLRYTLILSCRVPQYPLQRLQLLVLR